MSFPPYFFRKDSCSSEEIHSFSGETVMSFKPVPFVLLTNSLISSISLMHGMQVFDQNITIRKSPLKSFKLND